jgi:hypothetical protein
MTPEEHAILHAIATDDYPEATRLLSLFCANVDTSEPESLALAAAFLTEALGTSRVLRAHMAGEADTLTRLRRFASCQASVEPGLSLVG